MSQTRQMLQALKKCQRARGITYRELGERLGVSEPTIKRWFSTGAFTLKNLEEICNVLEVNILELAKLTDMYGPELITRLSWAQEQALADDPTLLRFFYLLINGYAAADIAADFELTELQTLALLTQLDRLGLIELHPENKVRLLTSRSVEWQENGPVRKAYEARIKKEFLKADFHDEDAALHFCTGELSPASLKMLSRKIRKLAFEFYEMAEIDLAADHSEKQSVGLMLAFRPWIFSLFEEWREEEK